MAKHHVIPRSRNGPDDEWNLIELSDYDHAYTHAVDFVLFESAPWFDCRQPGWRQLPNDLREAVRKEQSRRAKLDKRGERTGALNKGRKRPPISEEHREAIRKSNRRRVGYAPTDEHKANNAAGVRASWTPERREAQRQRMLGNTRGNKKQ